MRVSSFLLLSSMLEHTLCPIASNMRPRKLRLSAFTPFLLLANSAITQISTPNCSSSWEWTFNSLGQNPCTVGAYIMATCSGGSFIVDPLLPGETYVGPAGIDDGDLCKCNTIAYSLISACGACQGMSWRSWPLFSFNCTKVLPPSTLSNPIPPQTRVPQWALLDVTIEHTWNATKSFLVGDSPEIGPGVLLGPSGTSTLPTPEPSSVFTPIFPFTPTPVPISSGSKSNAGAIAGGVAGGLSALAISVLLILWRRRQNPQTPPTTLLGNEAQPSQQMAEVPPPQMAPASPMRLYNPNDSTTYPGPPTSPGTESNTPMTDTYYQGNASNTVNMHVSRAQNEYRGLPII
ncbi:hypothetical protein B0F90DRAFT_1407680 [Multifurca ochricompacta]|uniref:Uncharacterized protein n=1 Tax=Multifurca ochricompacta TaxID=376703 RepID=A0AAD4LWT3_9AGAM|nr:hypothetical protein B0F90DRAFT_1407680 [Multifurca ochricompacta]